MKKNSFKRLSLLLAVVMLFGMFQFAAMAGVSENNGDSVGSEQSVTDAVYSPSGGGEPASTGPDLQTTPFSIMGVGSPAVITTTLEKWKEYIGVMFPFSITVENGAVDETGTAVKPTVTINGTVIPAGQVIADSTTPGKYNLNLSKFTFMRTDGLYTVQINAVGTDGNTQTYKIEIISFNKSTAAQLTPVGQVIFMIERFAIGQCYYLEPEKVNIYSGDTVATVMIRALNAYAATQNAPNSSSPGSAGTFVTSSGSLTGGDFYIRSLYDPSMKNKTASPPQYIMDKIREEGKTLSGNSDDWLGEFDYDQMSGWVFSVNDKGLTASAASTAVKADDVIRMMFTLHGYGADVGCGLEGTNYRDFPAVAGLFRRVFQLRNDTMVKDMPEVVAACKEAEAYLEGSEQTAAGVAEQLDKLNAAVENLFPPLPTDAKGNYLISTLKEMKSFQYYVTTGETFKGKTILLQNNIDLGCSETAPWVPMVKFAGAFDGQGHTITGLYAEASGTNQYAALFRELAAGSVVRNLGVEGDIKVSTSAGGAMIAGMSAGTIERCYAGGTVSIATNDAYVKGGGIMCSAAAYDSVNFGYGSVADCFSKVDFKYTGTGTAQASVGGIAYLLQTGSNCYYTGTADPALKHYPITVPQYPMNVNGRTLFYDSERTQPSEYTGYNTQYGIGKTTAEMKVKESYEGFNFTRVWGMDPAVNDGYPYLRVFNGETPESLIPLTFDIKIKDKPFDRTTTAEVKSIGLTGMVDGDDVKVSYTISSAEFASADMAEGVLVTLKLSDILLTGADKDKYRIPLFLCFKVPGNIVSNTSVLPYDMSLGAYTISSKAEFLQFVNEVNSWNDFKGQKIVLKSDIDLEGSAENPWKTPIATSDTCRFSGTFDGNGKKLKNLYLKILDEDGDGSEDGSCALFDYLGAEGVVENLEFADVKVDASSNIYVSGGAGVVVAANYGTVTNCKIGGEVKNFSPSGTNNITVAGIAKSNYGTISNCLVSLDFDIVSNNNCAVCGIAWLNYTDSATQAKGKVENCVVNGSMKQTTDGSETSGFVSVFPTLPASASDLTKYQFNNIYYSSENCTPYSSTTSRVHVGTNLSLADLKDKSKLIGLDFGRYWGIDPAVNNGYPYLKLFEEEGAKPLIELGLSVKVKDKVFDGTTSGEVDTVALTNVLPEDEDKLTVSYDVKSVTFDNITTGTGKTVTVVFNNVTVGDTDGITAKKYTLSLKSYYTVKAAMTSNNTPPPERSTLIQQMKDYLKVYYNSGEFSSMYNPVKWNDGYEYNPDDGVEWQFIDYGLNNGYAQISEEHRQTVLGNWQKYLKGLRKYLGTHTIPNDKFKSTEYDRILLAMTVMGYNPDDFTELSIIDEISKSNFGQDGEIMGLAYGNIALDSGGYDYKTGSGYRTREDIVKNFDKKPEDVNLPAQTTVSDFFSMGLQPYIPYYNPDAKEGDADYKIKQYLDEVIKQLSTAQQSDGRFGNQWTTDQVVILLAGLGVDVTSDSRFVKNGHTALEVILNTLNKDTGVISGSMQYQHAETLMAVLKLLEGRKGSIYVMDSVVSDRAKAVIAAIDALPTVITAGDQAAVAAARAQYNALRQMEKKHVTNYEKLVAAENGGSGGGDTTVPETVMKAIANRYTRSWVSGNGDWPIIGMSVYGRPLVSGDGKNACAKITVGALRSNVMTDYGRIGLALTSLGYDVSDLAQYHLDLADKNGSPVTDMISQVTNFSGEYTSNGPIYALILLDSAGYAVPESSLWTRDRLLAEILKYQAGNGSFNLSTQYNGTGSANDVDMTAMALQALAPYTGRPEVAAAVNKAVAWLSSVQLGDGSFNASSEAGAGSSTSESTSQVVIALAALGIDADGDSRFVKGVGKEEKSALDGLMSFVTEDMDGFAHLRETGSNSYNSMATEQGFLALLAYQKFLDKGKKSVNVYDFTTPEQEVDLSDLNDKIAEVQELSEKDYTEESWASLLEALEAAKAVAADVNATKGQIRDALLELTNAMVALKPASPGEEGPPIEGKTITVTFTLIGDSKHGSADKHKAFQTWIPEMKLTLPEKSYVYDAFVMALDKRRLDYDETQHNYIGGIKAPGGYWLYEFDNGKYSGWMYKVNGKHPMYGLREYRIHDGDNIIWHYTDDYRYEEGSEKWAGENFRDGGSSTPTVETKLDASGRAIAKVEADEIQEQLEKVKKNIKEGKSAVLAMNIKMSDQARAMDVELSKEVVAALEDVKGSSLKITSGLSQITFDPAAVSAITDAAGKNAVTISVEKKDKANLPDEVKDVIGERPVLDFTVTVNGKKVPSFGTGTATIGIPYKLAADEDKNAVILYYINDSGELELVKNCRYDEKAGFVYFLINHFSRYAVGYNKVGFSDTAGKWMEGPVSYMAARGIIKGVGDNRFAPDQKTTRGQFVTMLMRALDLKNDLSKTEQFVDVAKGSYCYEAVLEARASGLIEGAGDNRFNPEAEISREDMFTITYRALKKLNLLEKYGESRGKAEFGDKALISSYAGDAVKVLADLGLVKGSNGGVDPKSDATRADCAQFIFNILTTRKD